MLRTQSKTDEERRIEYNDTEITWDNYTDNIYFKEEFINNDENCLLKFVIGEEPNPNVNDLRTYIKLYEGFENDKIIHFENGGMDKWVAVPQFHQNQDLLDCIESVLKEELEFHYHENNCRDLDTVLTFIIDKYGYEDDVVAFSEYITEY